MKLRWLFNACVTLACASCGDAEADAVGRVNAPILGGLPALEPNSIVGVVDFAGGQCSGSLIMPNLVLTARHCIAATEDDPTAIICEEASFLDPDSAGAVFVVPLPEVTDEPADYHAVEAIHLPPNAGDRLCGTDIALLQLKQPLSPVPLVPRVDADVRTGEVYSAIGYGVDASPLRGPGGVRRRLDGLMVVCDGSGCEDSEIHATEWLGSTGACSGDSGGPALDALGRVIGVVSRGKDGCTSPIYGAVESYSAWLKEEALWAAEILGSQAPNWAVGFPSDPEFHAPVGAACSSNAECPSNDCVSGFCTRACAADGPCPSGYLCNAETALCAREPAESAPGCTFRPSDPRRKPPLAMPLLLLAFAVARGRLLKTGRSWRMA